MSTLRALRLGATVFVAGLMSHGCFDSDQKIVVAAVDSTSTGDVPTATGTGTTLAGSSSTGEPPPDTCRDTLNCAAGCVLAMSGGQSNQIDLIFTCLLECEPSTVPEAIDVFRLIECATQDCIDRDQCDVLLPAEGTSTGPESSSSSGSSSSSSDGGSSDSSGSSSGSGSSGSSDSSSSSDGGSSSSDGGSSSSDGGPPPIDPQEQCTTCLILGLLADPETLDPEAFACYDEAVACQ